MHCLPNRLRSATPISNPLLSSPFPHPFPAPPWRHVGIGSQQIVPWHNQKPHAAGHLCVLRCTLVYIDGFLRVACSYGGGVWCAGGRAGRGSNEGRLVQTVLLHPSSVVSLYGDCSALLVPFRLVIESSLGRVATEGGNRR